MKEKKTYYRNREDETIFPIREAIKIAKEQNRLYSKMGVQYHLERVTINTARIAIENID